MRVAGAGMAGLLAAGMLRSGCTEIWEQQEQLPNNHSAVLRFRSSIVGDTLNIPFRNVRVIKDVARWKNSIADAMAYSQKTNGSGTLRSITSASGAVEERWIAPANLVSRMADAIPSTTIRMFGEKFDFGTASVDAPVISTIPMPVMMDLLSWKSDVEFRSQEGTNITIELDSSFDIFCSLYVPDPGLPFARISITGNVMVAECYREIPNLERDSLLALELCGLTKHDARRITSKTQRYAKILPIDENERRRFLMWATETHGIYSLGRFATWRPSLLLDDMVKDVRVIQRLAARQGEMYGHKLKDGMK